MSLSILVTLLANPVAVDPLIVEQFWVRVGVSLIMLVPALYVVVSKRYEAKEKSWAYGAIGTVIGYWLRP